MSRGWNPWATLRALPHVRLVYAELPDECGGGAIFDDGDGRRTVMLDFRLDRVSRRCALGHELEHERLDLLWPPGAPAALVDRGEETVRRSTALRLVPLDLLGALVDRITEMDEPVRAVDVMECFDVDVDTANRALWLLGQRRSA